VRRLLVAARKNNRATFTDLSELNAQSNEPSILAGSYLRALGISGWQELGQQDQWHISRIYGSLSDTQRRALEQGAAIQFASLAQSQKDLFTALTTSRPIDSFESTGRGTARQMGRMGEPTVMLANGIPGDAVLTLDLQTKTVPFYYERVTNGFRMRSFVDVMSIAMSQKAQDEGQPGRGPNYFAMGTLRTYKFRVRYADDMWQLFTVEEHIEDPGAKPGPWTDLPEDIVEQIKKAMGGG
jgi:hypothetical protein